MLIRLASILFLAYISSTLIGVQAQQLYYTKSGEISFYSDAPLEEIRAENREVISILNAENGQMIFKVKIRKFEFPNSLMQEHFNENYLESDQYPESKFKGHVLELKNGKIDLSKPGSYPVQVEGELTIHGVTQTIQTEGLLNIQQDGSITAGSKFEVRVEDYDIEIPKLVVKNIAEVVEVTVALTYKPRE